jgi:serine hydrolase
MVKKAYIIHMWGGNSISCWIPWLKEELQNEGIEAITPDMPDADAPDIEKWANCMQEKAPGPDNETCFVGHGIGCQSIVRYLSVMPENTIVKGAVFVAPWTNLVNATTNELEIAKPWIETPIDWQKVRARAKAFTVIYSDNDKRVTEKDAMNFGSNLGAKLVMDANRGHFTDDDDVTQLPSVLDETLKLFK